MVKLEVMEEIFGLVFFIGQRWQYITDRELARSNLTTRQWMMLAVIDTMFDYNPSIQEVAEKLSTTHQNVKQIAVNLEKRGFITIDRCHKDRRVLRLKTTDQNERFWRENADRNKKFVADFFAGFSGEELETLLGLMRKISARTEELYERAKEKTVPGEVLL